MFVLYDPVENKAMFYNGFKYGLLEITNPDLLPQLGHVAHCKNITALCKVKNDDLNNELDALFTLRNEISQLRALRTDIFISGTSPERFLYWLDKPTKQDKVMWPQVKTIKKYE